MAYTPITAPTPSTPSPWYALQPVTVLSPDGVENVWGILCEESGELLTTETDTEFPWFAKSRDCAISHVKYLNGITAEFPTCTCES